MNPDLWKLRIYPYTWNADSVRVTLTNGKVHQGDRLWYNQFTQSIYVRTSPGCMYGLAYNLVQSMQMLKRDRWYDLPLQLNGDEV